VFVSRGKIQTLMMIMLAIVPKENFAGTIQIGFGNYFFINWLEI
jgi:hypothetical protein